MNTVAQIIDSHIRGRALDGDGAVINAVDVCRTQFRRRQRQDAGASTNIYDTHTSMHTPLNLFQTHASSWMDARAKGHTGIKFQHHFVFSRRIVTPGRTNDEPFADVCHVEIVFPGVRPVFFIDYSRLQVAYKMLSQTGKMPQALGDALPRLLLIAVNGQVGMAIYWLSSQHAIFLSLSTNQFNRLLNCHAAGGIAAQ